MQVDDLDLRITAASLIDFTEEEWAKLGVTTKLVGDHFIQTADIRVDGASEGNAFARVRHYFFRPIATKADREQTANLLNLKANKDYVRGATGCLRDAC